MAVAQRSMALALPLALLCLAGTVESSREPTAQARVGEAGDSNNDGRKPHILMLLVVSG